MSDNVQVAGSTPDDHERARLAAARNNS